LEHESGQLAGLKRDDAAVAAIGVLLWLLPTSSKQQSAISQRQ